MLPTSQTLSLLAVGVAVATSVYAGTGASSTSTPVMMVDQLAEIALNDEAGLLPEAVIAVNCRKDWPFHPAQVCHVKMDNGTSIQLNDIVYEMTSGMKVAQDETGNYVISLEGVRFKASAEDTYRSLRRSLAQVGVAARIKSTQIPLGSLV